MFSAALFISFSMLQLYILGTGDLPRAAFIILSLLSIQMAIFVAKIIPI
jgi:hypothetical protein